MLLLEMNTISVFEFLKHKILGQAKKWKQFLLPSFWAINACGFISMLLKKSLICRNPSGIILNLASYLSHTAI